MCHWHGKGQIYSFPNPEGRALGVARIFDWGDPKPQITCKDVSRNFERGILCGGRDIVEWKIRNRVLVLARNQKLVQE